MSEEPKDGHFARLAGLAVARDGALLVGDDTNNTVYRVSYDGQGQATAAGASRRAAPLPDAVTAALPEAQGGGYDQRHLDGFRRERGEPRPAHGLKLRRRRNE
jgi:hypothetical protein